MLKALALRALLLCLVLASSGCTTLFFHPSRAEVLHPQRLGLEYEDVYLDTADGLRLHGWYLKAQGTARGTLLHLHGNAENISTFIAAVHWLPARGYNVFLLDYRGYGRSEGAAYVSGIHADAELALEYLVGRGGVDRDRLVVFGQSLGGSVAIHAVAHSPHRTQVRAVISEGAFSSYRRIAREKMQLLWLTRYLRGPLGFLFSDEYAAAPVVTEIAPVPLLIIHGDADPIVPVSHAHALYAPAREPKQLRILPGGKHVDSLARPEGRERFLEYLDRAVGAEQAPTSP